MSKHSEKVEEIKGKLIKLISEKRYNHSLNVAETAVKLAEHYSVDKESAEIAALLHDISKNFTIEEMLSYIGKTDLLDENSSEVVLHGIAGAVYSRNMFGIEDIDILNAIRYHTIGRRGMSELEKIVYMADVIEPTRDYDGIKKLRKEAFRDLDSAVLLEADRKIKFLIDKKRIIHLNTIEMRNWLTQKVKNKKKKEILNVK